MVAVQAVPVVPEVRNTYLVPFNFQTFRTGEAVWSLDKHELIQMVRLTTRGVGEFLGSTHRRPEKAIDKIIERNPRLKELAVPMTVTVTGDYKWGHSAVTVTAECPKTEVCSAVTVTYEQHSRTRQIVVNTWNIWGVYQIAIVSDFPRARRFLQEFPDLLQAFHNNTIKPPAIGDIKPEVVGFFGVPYHKRGRYVKNACQGLGWSKGTFYRKRTEARKMLGIPPEATKLTGQPKRPRSTKGESKYPDEREKAIAFYLANREKFKKYGNQFKEMTAEVAKKDLNLRAHAATISRWIREYENRRCLSHKAILN